MDGLWAPADLSHQKADLFSKLCQSVSALPHKGLSQSQRCKFHEMKIIFMFCLVSSVLRTPSTPGFQRFFLYVSVFGSEELYLEVTTKSTTLYDFIVSGSHRSERRGLI